MCAAVTTQKRYEFSSASREQLDIDSLDEVYRACRGCAAKWCPFGLRLGLSQDLLDEIEDDKKRSSSRLQRVLAEWLKGNYTVTPIHPRPSWYALGIAVAEGAEYPVLAERICAAHPQVEVPECTEKTLKDKCVCGNCSIKKVIEEGCPERQKQLDVKRLTPAQLYKISKATEKVKEQFANLLLNIANSMKDVPVDDLVIFLQGYAWFDQTTHKDDSRKKLEACKNAKEVFRVLADVCSWFNHEMLGKLMKPFGSEEAQSQYDTYVNDTLKKFLERNITEITNYGLEPSAGSSREFRLKMDTDQSHSNIAGTHLQHLKGSIAENLGIPLEHFQIVSFKDGCLEVVFSLPAVVYNELFPLSLSHSQALETLVVRHGSTELKFKSMFYEEKDTSTTCSPEREMDLDVSLFSDEVNASDLNILVVGPPNVGKRTVVDSLLPYTKPHIEIKGSVEMYTGHIGDITVNIYLYDIASSISENISSLTKVISEVDIALVCCEISSKPLDESVKFLQQTFGPEIWGKCIIVLTKASAQEDELERQTKQMKKQDAAFRNYLKKQGVSEDIISQIPVVVIGDIDSAKYKHIPVVDTLLRVCRARCDDKLRSTVVCKDSSKRYSYFPGAIIGGIVNGEIYQMFGKPAGMTISNHIRENQRDKCSKKTTQNLKRKRI